MSVSEGVVCVCVCVCATLVTLLDKCDMILTLNLTLDRIITFVCVYVGREGVLASECEIISTPKKKHDVF